MSVDFSGNTESTKMPPIALVDKYVNALTEYVIGILTQQDVDTLADGAIDGLSQLYCTKDENVTETVANHLVYVQLVAT